MIPSGASSPVLSMTDAAQDRSAGETTPAAVSIDDLLVHQELVFRVCLGYSRNYAEAEDLAQDVYLRAQQGLGSLREPSLAREWLLRIARNACLDLRKTNRGRAALLRRWFREPGPAPGPEAAGGDSDDRLGRLKAAVGRLPGKLRDIFVLREYGHLSYEELGAALSLNKGTVMSRLNRARARIAAELKETPHERP